MIANDSTAAWKGTQELVTEIYIVYLQKIRFKIINVSSLIQYTVKTIHNSLMDIYGGNDFKKIKYTSVSIGVMQ